MVRKKKPHVDMRRFKKSFIAFALDFRNLTVGIGTFRDVENVESVKSECRRANIAGRIANDRLLTQAPNTITGLVVGSLKIQMISGRSRTIPVVRDVLIRLVTVDIGNSLDVFDLSSVKSGGHDASIYEDYNA